MKNQPETTSLLRVLVVDDEALARSRLRSQLANGANNLKVMPSEASSAQQALEILQQQAVDVVLMDIHMPGLDGLALAQKIRNLERAPAVIFVTAFAEHAVKAFELEAQDYLTKPVRLERLQTALHKAQRFLQERDRSSEPVIAQEVLIIHERSRTERVPLQQVVYFKAELKYITVRTAARSYIMDGSLNDLEQKYGQQFMRIHRNALIAKRAVRSLEKHYDPQEGECWTVRLVGVDEKLQVSRRQLTGVRDLIGRKN